VDSREFEKLYSDNIEVIVLDIFMLGLDGVQLLRLLAEKNSQSSIVLMSGKDKSVLHSA